MRAPGKFVFRGVPSVCTVPCASKFLWRKDEHYSFFFFCVSFLARSDYVNLVCLFQLHKRSFVGTCKNQFENKKKEISRWEYCGVRRVGPDTTDKKKYRFHCRRDACLPCRHPIPRTSSAFRHPVRQCIQLSLNAAYTYADNRVLFPRTRWTNWTNVCKHCVWNDILAFRPRPSIFFFLLVNSSHP